MLCLITGATTRTAIITTSMWLGPILGACMVPVTYLLGKVLWDRRVGIVAAALVSFTSFRLFFLSSYGFVDHHIAEVITISLFFLAYCFTLSYTRVHPPGFSRPRSLWPPEGSPWSAGYSSLPGSSRVPRLSSPLLSSGLYTAIQITIDTFEDRPVHYLILMNSIVFLTAILSFLVFGFKAGGVSLVQYLQGTSMPTVPSSRKHASFSHSHGWQGAGNGCTSFF